MRRKVFGAIGVFLFVVLIAVVYLGITMFRHNLPGTAKADTAAYFGLNADDESRAAIIIDHNRADATAIMADGTAYLPLDTVTSYLNSRFYSDAETNSLLYALPTEVVGIGVGSTDDSVSGNGGQALITGDDGGLYLALPVIQKYTAINVSIYDKPNRICILRDGKSADKAKLKKDAQVFESSANDAGVLADVPEGAAVTVLEAGKKWTKVATDDGYTGFVRSKYLGKTGKETVETGFVGPEYTSLLRDHKICMGWQQVTSFSANANLERILAADTSINTIAPTWFFMKDTAGNLESLADADYVNQAHAAGKEVWATVNDFDGASLCGGINSTEQTLALLSSYSARSNLINGLVSGAAGVGCDGINVDIEKVSEECGPHYIQFVRELSAACRNAGLVLSVDQYVPSTWTTHFRRDEQAVFCDYIVIMAYDENGSWSTEIGPNSSMNYVSDAITDTLKDVPAEKVIMALPFYAKLWKETPVNGTNTDSIEVTSVTMMQAEELLAAHGAVPQYDESSGQNKAVYQDGSDYYTIWLEDAQSVDKKLAMIKEHDLAGAAFWKLGQEDSEIWKTIAPYYQ